MSFPLASHPHYSPPALARRTGTRIANTDGTNLITVVTPHAQPIITVFECRNTSGVRRYARTGARRRNANKVTPIPDVMCYICACILDRNGKTVCTSVGYDAKDCEHWSCIACSGCAWLRAR